MVVRHSLPGMTGVVWLAALACTAQHGTAWDNTAWQTLQAQQIMLTPL
jgi:hypothetical protein